MMGYIIKSDVAHILTSGSKIDGYNNSNKLVVPKNSSLRIIKE